MSQVLISFLGTGPANGHERGQYQTTRYKFQGDIDEYTSPFVADVICQKYRVDKVFLIGTMHSIWDGIYDHFSQRYEREVDCQVWSEIYTQCQEANSKTAVGNIQHQDEIEEVLGNGSKVITIYYGLNQEEINKNSAIILGIEQYLNEGDELIIDITHSFRSLPMYIMNLLVYLQNVSTKNLSISHICYGMYDVVSELGYAPIIEMQDILRVNEWISGAYSFKRFGNADKIVELVRTSDRELSRRLDLFSKTKNLNHLAELERESQQLGDLLKNDNLPDMARLIITPVIQDFINRLQVDPQSPFQHSDFQFKLALWQRNNHNYLAAYISLLEAIITYLAELYNAKNEAEIDVYDKNVRDGIKNIIRNRYDESIERDWKALYRDVSTNRNMLAHNVRNIPNIPRNTPVAEYFTNKLREYINRYRQLVQRQ